MCVLSTSNDFYRTSNDGLQIISDGFLLMDFFFSSEKIPYTSVSLWAFKA